MSFLEDIANKLQALGLGIVGTDIFIGALPSTPYVAFGVFEYGGLAPNKGFGTPVLRYETPAVQVLARGEPQDYEGPRTRAQTAYTGLNAVEAEVLGTTFYHWITAQQAPFLLRRDENQCVVIACNYLCQKDA